jgi:hypothetical protein
MGLPGAPRSYRRAAGPPTARSVTGPGSATVLPCPAPGRPRPARSSSRASPSSSPRSHRAPPRPHPTPTRSSPPARRTRSASPRSAPPPATRSSARSRCAASRTRSPSSLRSRTRASRSGGRRARAIGGPRRHHRPRRGWGDTGDAARRARRRCGGDAAYVRFSPRPRPRTRKASDVGPPRVVRSRSRPTTPRRGSSWRTRGGRPLRGPSTRYACATLRRRPRRMGARRPQTSARRRREGRPAAADGRGLAHADPARRARPVRRRRVRARRRRRRPRGRPPRRGCAGPRRRLARRAAVRPTGHVPPRAVARPRRRSRGRPRRGPRHAPGRARGPSGRWARPATTSVAPSPGEAVAAAVDTLAQREAVGRARTAEALRWVAFGAGSATHALLSAPAGYGATRRVVARRHLAVDPRRRVGPRVRPPPRRARRRPPAPRPRDRRRRALFRATSRRPGSLLDFLPSSPTPTARALPSSPAPPTAQPRSGAARAAIRTRSTLAPPSPTPRPAPRDDGGRGAWKVTKRSACPRPRATALFARRTHGVAGSLWLAGRPYRCRPVSDGQAVEVEALAAGAPPRVVRAPGVVPFSIPREGGGGFVEVRVELLRDGPSWTASAADGWGGTVDGHALVFADLDLDGRYGGFLRDGVATDAAFTFPLRRELVLDRKVLELRRVGPDGRAVAWRARPLAARRDPGRSCGGTRGAPPAACRSVADETLAAEAAPTSGPSRDPSGTRGPLASASPRPRCPPRCRPGSRTPPRARCCSTPTRARRASRRRTASWPCESSTRRRRRGSSGRSCSRTRRGPRCRRGPRTRPTRPGVRSPSRSAPAPTSTRCCNSSRRSPTRAARRCRTFDRRPGPSRRWCSPRRGWRGDDVRVARPVALAGRDDRASGTFSVE